MEHLLFNGEDAAPVSIPYFGSEFDCGDFFTFPERQGWDISSWEYAEPEPNELNLNNRSFPEMASFLQSWLFFGLLAAFLGDRFSTNDFIRTYEAGNKFITTKMLGGHLEEWSKVHNSMPGNEMQEHGNLLETYLTKARMVNNTLNFVLFYETEPSDSETLRQTLFAQMLLCEALYGATVEVFKIQPFNDKIFHDTYLRKHLLMSGWCVTTVEYMQSKLPLQVQAHALAMGSTRNGPIHGDCTQYDPDGCKRSRIGPDFKQKHVTSDCKCVQVRVPTERLVDILRDGMIPIVTIKRSGCPPGPIELLLDGLDLDYPGFESLGGPYFAFSHVWSDGLGNEDDNALYQCQLERLDSMLQSLEGDRVNIAKLNFDTTARELGTVAFWLDTLCIPVQDEYKKLRQFSIKNMHKIYSKAAGVVVVDPDIQNLSEESKPVQVLTRVLCSRWRSRMWTYEEASLVSQLYLPVGGSCFSIQSEEELFEPSGEPTSLVELQLLRKSWERFFDLIWDRRASYCIAINPARSFVRMVTAVSNRNTTKRGDETICFATFFGLDTTHLVHTAVEERMPILLSLLPAIPGEILFAAGPHLEQKGYRWAPKSYLNSLGLLEYLGIVMPKDFAEDKLPSSRRCRVPHPFIHTGNLGLAIFLSGIQFQRESSVTAPLLFSIETQTHGAYTVEAVDTGSKVPWMLSESSSEKGSFAILLTDLRYCSIGLLVKILGETMDGKLLCKWGSVVEITSNEESQGLWVGLAKDTCFQGVHVPFQWWVVD